jgi:hypothetical protein
MPSSSLLLSSSSSSSLLAQERILHQYGISKLQQESLVVMPRRSGKTWSMAMFCAAMLLVCSDIEISVFATGQRTASKLLKLMTKMLKSAVEFIGGDSFKFLQQNKEAVVLLGPDKTERTCGCYPGSVTVSCPFNVATSERDGRQVRDVLLLKLDGRVERERERERE